MKKCLVLDLDNTLWGGIVGEDGVQNLQLSMNPPGNSFIAFQQAILDHYNKGVILAINSRNNPEDAWSVIREHPNMILKEHHFAAHRINWQDKATNIRELAQELNIGLDSMVFLDDDEGNRGLVRSLIPEVEVPELPKDPKDYVKFLNSLQYFTTEVLTDEDKMRGNLYVTERLRKEEEKMYKNKEDFLRGLQLQMSFCEDDASCLPRLAQLTEKTNQFNTVKQPLTEQEIAHHIVSDSSVVFHASLQDRFGDYGVILFALVSIEGDVWRIRSMLMSCRVFGKDIELAFLGKIIQRAKEQGALKLCIDFIKTEKNKPAEDFVINVFKNKEYPLQVPYTMPDWVTIL